MSLLVCSLAPTALVDGSSWRMMLNVGRVDGSAMPASWAASGGRLLLPLGVRFDGGRAQPSDGAVKFVGPRGEESVAVEESDGWHATEKNFLGESELRFSLQIGGARRNDVSLPPGRYFFRARCWDDETLPDAEEQVAELEREATWRAAARLVLPPVRRHWRLAGGDDFAIVGTFSWAPSADVDA
ncbi:hypothetical protein EMIHUDRAFT_206324 [Emiliania huxleyi CCMP1516]|uniref:Uncharacterized protein n=2 Tax=Emiliania huxleyi TaxID=2903 RepID=A0A0D3JNT6_EMIH1|nr:hypothetical protein EMIHUDRAFT_206324 [Emiliania huxleyi CCMP1516]EOD25171.1 hypothetical protein EMIHUDRAFT_206324 [Emiliania huxleyi CCMP1516]|eukprot:XP_005777600.1 hypothetical protein EMIHUDRAFT_206324 [Emiliania huxleyi CCMP1516]